MKLIKFSLAAALAVTVAHAEMSDIGVSANMALTTNYVWRGMSQTSNAPAIQGGILIIATIIILVNLGVDLLYGIINPRIRYTS